MIETMFTLSTAHLAAATSTEWLARGTLVAFSKGGQGWFIPVPDESVVDIPTDLAECFALARGSSCDWLNFDSAMPPLAILPIYDQTPAMPAND